MQNRIIIRPFKKGNTYIGVSPTHELIKSCENLSKILEKDGFEDNEKQVNMRGLLITFDGF